MLLVSCGSPHATLHPRAIKAALVSALRRLGPRRRVLIIPPDFTRVHSGAGDLTRYAWEFYGDALTDILPALGTHSPMTDVQIRTMFPGVPRELFRVHDWRTGVVTLGRVPASFVHNVSEGAVRYAWPAQVARLVAEGGHDLILSIGQVVPHEVIGMANHNKNLFVGTGGPEGIHRSHFLGAVYGMERIMGRADTPVRRVLEYASLHFARHLPIVYVLTVVGRNARGRRVTRGLFVGDDAECFHRAAALSRRVNVTMLDDPLARVVVYLDPHEFKSTWLGNKGIYRTRMAMADGGELILLAPGLREFGEDHDIDRMIRRFGYVGTAAILRAVKDHAELRAHLSAAAHLIHGSTEERFTVTYCPGRLHRREIESVNFQYADLRTMLRYYDPRKLRDGWNTLPGGERIYYISNPAMGLWTCRHRFQEKGR